MLNLNVQVDFPLFQRLALPVKVGKTPIAGIKIQDTRMIRLMEVRLHGGPQLNGWPTAPTRPVSVATGTPLPSGSGRGTPSE